MVMWLSWFIMLSKMFDGFISADHFDGLSILQNDYHKTAFLLSSHPSPLPSSHISSSSNLHQISPGCDIFYASSTVKSDYFTSPGYPDSYPPQITCRYVFEGEGKERVQLAFLDFDLPTLEDKSGSDPHECEDLDTVTVSVLIGEDVRDLASHCGRNIPHQLMSHNNRMEVIFKAKQRDRNHVSERGFKAKFNFVTDFGMKTGIQDMNMDCGFTYSSDIPANGTFTSPNFPGLYPRNIECHYLFYGKPSECIHITFKTFDVEGIPPLCDADTQSDYVEFSNFNVELMDRKMSRICGSKQDQVKKMVSSDGNFFRVTFKSNDVFDSTGFEAFYQFKKIEDLLSNKPQKAGTVQSFVVNHNLVLFVLLLTAFNHQR